jgi:YVTN family beta-propeller protein
MRFGILGQLEVSDGARDVTIAQGRQRLLLAVLLVHANEPVSSERLVDALWGETPPPTAIRSLHNHVSALRKALGDGHLATEAHGYRLAVAGDALDAARFDDLAERGRAALAAGEPGRSADLLDEGLAQWRGPAFGDLANAAAIASAAASLDERRIAAVEDRIDADLALGRHARLVAELDRLVAEHPLRERLRGQQMLALYRCGRQADALAAYAAARRYLVDELGIEPGPALRGLERAILEQDPALGPPEGLPPPSRPDPLARARRHPWRLAAAGAALLVAAVAGALLATGGGGQESAGAAVTTGDQLVAIDPVTNRIAQRATVGGTPTSVTVGGGAVWTLNSDDRTISRLDLEAGTVRNFASAASPLDLAADADALWAAQAAPTASKRSMPHPFIAASVTRFDPATGTGIATTPLPAPTRVTLPPTSGQIVALGGGAVWTLGPGGVHRLDLRTGRMTSRRSFDAEMVAAGDGHVWIYDRRRRAVRLDPGNGRATGHVTLPVGQIDALAVGEGGVWLTDSSEGTVWRVDPETLAVRTVAVQPGADSVAAGGGAVWVANSVRGTVSRIDPESNRVTATIPVGGTPRGVAVGGGRVWVTVAGAARATPPAAGLAATARVKALPAPPCSAVLTGGSGDPDLLIAADFPFGATIGNTLPMTKAVAFVLREHRFRAGRFTLGYQSCDSANATTGLIDFAKCRQDARDYVNNPAVIGVVGPLQSPCAWNMLPVLSRAGDNQPALVSPTNSDPELVRREPTASGDVLGRLYPGGQRGYARVFPSDDYETAAGAILADRLGHGRVYFLQDRDYSADGPTWTWFRRAARRLGLRIIGNATWTGDDRNYRALAQRVRASGARAVYINSSVPANLGRLLRDLRAAVGPDVAIIGSSMFTPVGDLFAHAGAAARGVYITSPGVMPDALGPSGKRFVRAFGATLKGGQVSVEDVYTAAATEVLLAAIARSDGTRPSVVRALADTHLPDSVLGPVDLARNGEPAAQPVTVFRAEHGGGRSDLFGNLDGAVAQDVIVPPARLVGPPPG